MEYGSIMALWMTHPQISVNFRSLKNHQKFGKNLAKKEENPSPEINRWSINPSVKEAGEFGHNSLHSAASKYL